MALTAKQRKIIKDGLADGKVGDEIADAIDAAGNAVGADVSDIASVDASDLATVITLANETKAQVNALLASLRAAGIIA